MAHLFESLNEFEKQTNWFKNFYGFKIEEEFSELEMINMITGWLEKTKLKTNDIPLLATSNISLLVLDTLSEFDFKLVTPSKILILI